MCPCGIAKESRTHIVGECETCKEERDVLGDKANKRMRYGEILYTTNRW